VGERQKEKQQGKQKGGKRHSDRKREGASLVFLSSFSSFSLERERTREKAKDIATERDKAQAERKSLERKMRHALSKERKKGKKKSFSPCVSILERKKERER